MGSSPVEVAGRAGDLGEKLQHCKVACRATNGNRARGRKQGPRGSQGEGIMGELEHSQVCAIIQLCWR